MEWTIPAFAFPAEAGTGPGNDCDKSHQNNYIIMSMCSGDMLLPQICINILQMPYLLFNMYHLVATDKDPSK